MKRFTWEKLGMWLAISAAFSFTVVFSFLALFVAIPASSSRKLFDYLVNTLKGVDEDTGEWMFTHPIDILIQTTGLLKPKVSKARLAGMFKKSEPPFMRGEHSVDTGDELLDEYEGEVDGSVLDKCGEVDSDQELIDTLLSVKPKRSKAA